jgi:hypothetical protein
MKFNKNQGVHTLNVHYLNTNSGKSQVTLWIFLNKKKIFSLERVDAEQCLIKSKTVLPFPGRSLCKLTTPP